MNVRERRARAILVALFLSGFAGLVHEIAWARLLEQLIGSTAHAHAAVLMVFMGGLALGGVLFGRRSDRRRDPLATYVALELMIAAYSLVLPWIVRGASGAYEALARTHLEDAELKFALRFALSLVAILAPAVWMGGTLPLLARELIQELSTTRREVARLYAFNNLGAVLGTGIAGFFALAAFGIHGSLALASSFNVAAAAIVWFARRGSVAAPEPATFASFTAPVAEGAPPAAGQGYSEGQVRIALIALFLSGFAAMGYEVVIIRLIALSFGASTYSFTVMLMAFIAGIGIGSALISRAKVERPLVWLAASQLGVVLAMLAITPLFARLPYWIGLLRIAAQPDSFELFVAGEAFLCLAILLAPTICLGCGFPLVAQVEARSLARVGSAIGSTYAWNTVGNVLGVVVTSLLLIPHVGALGALNANLALNLAGGLALALVATEARAAQRVAAAGVIAVAALVYAGFGQGWIESINYAHHHLRLRSGPDPSLPPEQIAAHPASSFESWKRAYVSPPGSSPIWHFEEDANLTVLVEGRPEQQITLFVNGKPDASTRADLGTQLLIAHLPLFLAERTRSLLIIGHGSGITAGSAMLHPVERCEIIEISHGVLASDPLFANDNYHVLSDPRVSVQLEDGRTYLRTAPSRYDVIISEPSNPWVVGVAPLFTRDYFEDCRDRLEPGGIFCGWFHEYEQSDEAIQLILRTLTSVFPDAMLFHVFNGDVFAVASNATIRPDFARMEALFDTPSIRADLARIGVFELASLLVHHVMPGERVPLLLGRGPLNTDDHQRLEYVTPRAFFEGSPSTLIWRSNGFVVGGTFKDCMLDRYLEWRRAQKEPFTQDEVEETLQHLEPLLPPADWEQLMQRDAVVSKTHSGLRDFDALRARLQPAVSASELGSRPARGATPPLETLGQDEALRRGMSLAKRGRHAESLPLFQRALTLAPADDATRVGLARCLRELSREDESRKVLEEGLALAPQSAALHLELGRDDLRRSELERARQHAEAALASAESADGFTLLGDVLAAQEHDAQALDCYQRALAHDGNHWQAALGMAKVLAKKPETRPQAKLYIEEGLRAFPNNAQFAELQRALSAKHP